MASFLSRSNHHKYWTEGVILAIADSLKWPLVKMLSMRLFEASHFEFNEYGFDIYKVS